MSVLVGSSLERVNAERKTLLRNFVEVANLGAQLEQMKTEIERSIVLLQALIDPENY